MSGPAGESPAATEQPVTTDEAEGPAADDEGGEKEQPAEATDGTSGADDEAWPDPAYIDSALGQWAGTASVDTLPSPDGLPRLVSQELYDTSHGLTLDAEALQNTEYLGSHGATCTGSVKVGSSPALCTFMGAEGEEHAGKELTATVHLVRSAAGSHALLMAVGEGEAAELALAGDTQMLLGEVDHGVEVTGEMIGAGLVEAARLAASRDGEVTDNAEVVCKLHGDEAHAVCQLSALDEGTSGFWYATVQPGPDYEGYTYLYTQFIE